MKINTNIKGNYFNCFDEARGFAINKRKIINNKNKKCFTYLERKIVVFLIIIAVGILFFLISKRLFTLSYIIFIFALSYLLSSLIYIVYIYNFRKKQGFNNIITFDKEGITDKSYYGIKITITWDKIIGIVIGKYTITFLTDTAIYFYFDIKEKGRITKALKKYSNTKKIIK